MSRKVFFFPLQINLFPSSCHVVTGNTNRQTGKNILPFPSRRGQQHTPKQEKKNFFSKNSRRPPKYLCILCLFTPTPPHPIVYSVSPTPPSDCKTNNPDGQLLFLSSAKFNFCIGKRERTECFCCG
ncbi:hypothetical protein CEXT_326881 [Caerostris extrusa]|uniref:Uncharacterized protein n=1 Tax=Caerostris extrusa TaxID=172846 RepID=A0AAV4T558_CAEEX|nr:hypothetical protein CEXT_326881 [Caerostris extrusa]